MGRPAPSSAGYQPKSKPFNIIMCGTTTLAANFSLTQELKSSSAFPVSSQECRSQKSELLVAAIMIDTIGTKTIPLDLGFCKWSFILVNVNYPMLDANFSAASISSLTSTPVTSLTLKHENVPGGCDKALAPWLNACTENELADILKKFLLVTQPQFSTVDIKHRVE